MRFLFRALLLAGVCLGLTLGCKKKPDTTTAPAESEGPPHAPAFQLAPLTGPASLAYRRRPAGPGGSVPGGLRGRLQRPSVLPVFVPPEGGPGGRGAFRLRGGP